MADQESKVGQNLRWVFNIRVERSGRQGLYDMEFQRGGLGRGKALSTETLESPHPQCCHPGLSCPSASSDDRHGFLAALLPSSTLTPA